MTPEQAQLFVFEADEIEQHWQEWHNRLDRFYAAEVATSVMCPMPHGDGGRTRV